MSVGFRACPLDGWAMRKGALLSYDFSTCDGSCLDDGIERGINIRCPALPVSEERTRGKRRHKPYAAAFGSP